MVSGGKVAENRWRGRLVAHARFIARFLAVFVPVYSLGLWRGAAAEAPWVLVFAWERGWPFVPAMIVLYLSLLAAWGMPLLLLPVDRYPALTRQVVRAVLACGVVFMALPTTSGFTAHAPVPAALDPAFALLGLVDRPFNLFPSLHVVGAALVLLASADHAPRALAWALRGWLGLIALSTLFVHQHHLADLAAGLALALGIRRRWPLCAGR